MEKDLMKGMPLGLVMKLEVRCDALAMYEKMSDIQKAGAEEEARRLGTPEGRERVIDRIARGDFNFTL